MIRLFSTTALLALTLASHAQAPGNGGPIPQAPAAVPLDGGATLLLASGVAYGLRHLRQRRKAQGQRAA